MVRAGLLELREEVRAGFAAERMRKNLPVDAPCRCTLECVDCPWTHSAFSPDHAVREWDWHLWDEHHDEWNIIHFGRKGRHKM